MQKEFRIKDTRFRVVSRPDGLYALFRANRYGRASWWFLGRFPSENAYRTAARKNAATRPLKPRAESHPSDTLTGARRQFSSALARVTVKRFDDE